MAIPVVLLTGNDPSLGQGGGSVYVRSHARAAQRAGFEPHVFCLSHEQGVVDTDFGVLHRARAAFRPGGSFRVAPSTDPHRVIAHWIGGFAFSPYAVPIQARVLVTALEAFLRAHPAVRLVHSFYTWGAVAVSVRQRLARDQRRLKVVNSIYTTLHHEVAGRVEGARATGNRGLARLYAAEALWTRSVAGPFERRALTGCDVLGFNYDSVATLARQDYGPLRHARRLAYGPESGFLRPPIRPSPGEHASRPPRIVTVSRHDPRKGLDVLLHALGMLAAEGLAFDAILGSGGPLMQHHQRLLDALGLSSRVTLSGWLDDPVELLLDGDIFVLPSIEEGSGSLALLEAMQFGRAIVASDVDGIPEDITHGVDGLLAPPGDPAALAAALRRLLLDPAERQRLGDAAGKTYDHRFSGQAFTDQLAELYGELITP